MKRPMLFVALTLVAMPKLAVARPKAVACEIRQSAIDSIWRGQCRLWPGTKGAFSIEPVTRALDVIFFNLRPTGPTKFEVRGLSPEGINSYWGTAHARVKAKSCWVSDDFQVCIVNCGRRHLKIHHQ